MLEKESVTDLAKQTWPGHENEAPDSDRLAMSSAYIRGGIEDEGEMMQELFHSHYKKFLGDKIPEIDHMTPREAAKRPEMRARLITLMKGHLQTMDGHSKKDGRDYDMGWVLDELGLGELKVPARAASKASAGKWWRELDDQSFAARLQGVISDPMGAFSLDDFPALAEYFVTTTDKLLNTKEKDSLILMINCAIAALIPEGVAVEDIEAVEMIRETNALFDQIIPTVATDPESIHPINILVEISVQPAIMSFVARLFITLTKSGKLLGIIPFGKKVRSENIVPMLVQIEAFLRCLRRAALR